MNITKATGIKHCSRDRIRELVRIRDNYTYQNKDCKFVWIPGTRRLDVHHTDFDKEKTRRCDKISDMNEMITYCHKCHLNLPEHKQAIKDGIKKAKA